jgi:hypothetical protein
MLCYSVTEHVVNKNYLKKVTQPQRSPHRGRDLQTIQSLQPRSPSYKRLLRKGLTVTWEAHSANSNNPPHSHIRAKPLTVSTPPAVVHDALFAHYSCAFYTQERLDVASDRDLSLAKLPVFN